MEKPSIVYPQKTCAAHSSKEDCEGPLHLHHIIYGTAGRKLSKKHRLTCHLCYKHHEGKPYGVHGGNNELDLELKIAAEKAWCETNHKTIEEFIEVFGKNYI